MARKACEDVAKRSQLTAQIISPDNDGQCYLSSTGQAVCIGEVGVLGDYVCEGRYECLPPISHALEGGPW